MMYGYYVAATRQRHGDRRLSATAARAWRRHGHASPGRYAGASAWLDDERFAIRVVANDLFAPKMVYRVQDFAFKNDPCTDSAEGEP